MLRHLLALASLLGFIHGQVQVPWSMGEPAALSSRLSGKFLHITDFHPDWFYRPGAKLENMCHFRPRDSADTVNDFAYDETKKKSGHKDALAGYWGPPAGTECDTSIQLVNATFEYIQRELKDLDFVIWTGDNARHDNDNRYPRTLKQIYDSNAFMVQKMQEIFGSDKYSEDFIPVVPTVGNNDVYPHNIMYAGPSSRTIAEYKAMWKVWVPPEQSHTFDRGAYFHMPVAPQLSVVSLNSLYFYENNKAVDGCSSRDEPGSLQLDWLEIQLRLFRQQKIKVWIIGHIPPTERQWYDGCYDRYANLMIEYRDLIVGQVFGHVNIDHFYFLKHKTNAAQSSNRVQLLDKTVATKETLHILKSPLDVLNEAREIFDALPAVSPGQKHKSMDDIDATVGHLAVINVGPSVVPNYYPTLRVYEYLTHDTDNTDELIHDEKSKKKRKKRKKKKKKPTIPPVDALGPGYVRQKYTPLKYKQYYLNLTEANGNSSSSSIQYQLEYDTADAPYSMPDLTVPSWVALGNEISGRNGRGKISKKVIEDDVVLANMVDNADTDGLDLWSDGDVSSDLAKKKKKKKKKHKKKKDKRNDGFWKVFVYRGFVSTGLEKTYRDDSV